MPNEVLYQSLNVGVVDKDKLHRVDLEKLRLAAEDQTNWMCDAVGRMFLRPGTEYLGEELGKSRIITFNASLDQVYAFELSNAKLRIWDGDAIVSRPAVATTIPNGAFNTGASWTLGTSDGTDVSIGGGQLKLLARAAGARATAKQTISAGADSGKEHALNIRIARGPVTLRVGSSSGGQQYVRQTTLRTGYHSIAFVPTGNFYIEFSTRLNHAVYVEYCSIDGAGPVVLNTPWLTADLPNIRVDQSLDVMFVACEGRKQMRIESRGDNSFSVCEYDVDDGPFLVGKTSECTLNPSVLEGSGTLTASLPFFNAGHVGALFRLYHDGQKIDTILARDNTFTRPIMVTGINEPDYNEREFTNQISGTWAGTLSTQRSFDGEDVGFHNFRREQGSSVIPITANATFTNDDNEDNAIAYYRVGFRGSTYTSGEARIRLTYDGGGGYGICRVTEYVDSTHVLIDVLKPFSGDGATDDWREGAWSDNNGWPTGVVIDGGRLVWVGYDSIWGSVSDAYESMDEDFDGDAGPLLRAIGVGGRQEARWILPLSNLMVGTGTILASIRASSLDEILTPENFGVRKLPGLVGAARVNPALLSDDRALFVEASGNALYEVTFSNEKGNFVATEFSKLTTELFEAGITGIAVQNRPDQRIWITTDQGDAVCIVYEPDQKVVAFIPVSTSQENDFIESIAIQPGVGQDRVVASVRRDGKINAGVPDTNYYFERLALDDEAKPGDITKCLDSHVTFGPGSAVISVPHLEDRTVRVWADGDSVDDANGNPIDFLATGGQITLPFVPTIGGCVGLPYRARYKSARVEYGAGTSTSVLKKRVIAKIGLLLADYVRSGIKIGGEFDNANHPLHSLPNFINGRAPASDVIIGLGDDEEAHPFAGQVGFDQRVCIEANSPKPAAVLSMVFGIENHGG